MKIKSLHLKDFRGIAELSLDLDDKMTVLAGVNGVGKTAIIEAIALVLRHLVQPESKEPVEYAPGKFGTEVPTTRTFDVREGRSQARVDATIELLGRTTTCGVTLERVEPDTPPGVATVELDRSLLDAQAVFAKLLEQSELVPLFAIGYYRDERTIEALNPARTQEEPFRLQRRQAYAEAFDGYSEFLKWLLARESYENEIIRDDPQARDGQLEAVRQAIGQGMPHLKNLRVRRTAQKITVTKDRVDLDVAELAPGEKTVMLLFADIARRLAMAALTPLNRLEAEGIILIDELELHLHPAWQRMVPEKLPQVFPNVQFVVTTHSPQVLSAIEPGKVVVLQRAPDGTMTVERPTTFGRTSDLILEAVLGVPERKSDVKDLLHELYVALDDDRLDEAKKLRADLERRLGPGEPELGRIDVLIRRAEARRA